MDKLHTLFYDTACQSLWDLIPEPAIIADVGFMIFHLNPQAQAILGYRELSPDSFAQLVQTPIAEISQELEKKQAQIRLHSSLSTASGEEKYFEWHISRCPESSRHYIFCYDRTRSQRTDEKLMRALKELNDQKYALDQTSIVAITDRQGRITYVNDKFVEISEYSAEELIGKDHRLINSGRHDRQFFRQMWQTISKGQVWHGEICNRTKSGSLYWVHTTIVPFLDGQGRPYQYIAVRTDINDKKKALAQIEAEQARTLYAEKMASLGQMAAGIAHELGNPINAITSWLEVVSHGLSRGSMDPHSLAESMPMVKATAERMAKIIRGMLTFARDGSKDPFETVHLPFMIDGVLQYCQFKIRKNGINLHTSFHQDSFFCHGRAAELSQVFVNLILNSCDAIKDLEERWIELQSYEENGMLVIHFTDSGTGIAKEIADKIMNPFFTTKPSGQGTGLGLSISRSILIEHGGNLLLDTQHPHTRFIISLPSLLAAPKHPAHPSSSYQLLS